MRSWSGCRSPAAFPGTEYVARAMALREVPGGRRGVRGTVVGQRSAMPGARGFLAWKRFAELVRMISKYRKLRRHLARSNLIRVDLGMDEIESLIAGPLPARARQTEEWWTAGRRYWFLGHANAWLGAGYKVSFVRMDRGWVRCIADHEWRCWPLHKNAQRNSLTSACPVDSAHCQPAFTIHLALRSFSTAPTATSAGRAGAP
jgi:hypothetical protein